MARPRTDIAPRVIAAARARFLSHGVDGASLRDIARDAKTSIGMVYYYWKSKDDLFLAVVEDVYARLLTDLTVVFGNDKASLEEQVRAIFDRMAGASDEELTVLRIVIREMLSSTERRAKMLARFQRGHIPRLLGAMTAARQAGQVRELNPLVAAMATMLLAIFPALISRLGGPQLPPGFVPAPPQMAAQMADILLHGLARAKTA